LIFRPKHHRAEENILEHRGKIAVETQCMRPSFSMHPLSTPSEDDHDIRMSARSSTIRDGIIADRRRLDKLPFQRPHPEIASPIPPPGRPASGMQALPSPPARPRRAGGQGSAAL